MYLHVNSIILSFIDHLYILSDLIIIKINMSSENYGAAPFFGFMGVSMALVLASIAFDT